MFKKKFVIEYALDYVHRVRVGIMAANEDAAVSVAQQKYDEGTLWEDSDTMPLLYDDYEEADDNVLEFRPVDSDRDVFPAPNTGVLSMRQRDDALNAARLLVQAYENGHENGGSVDWSDVDLAHEAALKAINAFQGAEHAE